MVKFVKDIYVSLSTIFKGMGITFKYLGKRPVTQQYPDERWALPERFRGFVHNDVPRCTACMLCAKDCPVDCIYIELEGKGKERQMTRYAIDYNKCIWCSLCTEHCPTHCITMSHDYDHSVYKREKLVYEFVTEPVTPYKPKKDEKAKPAAGAKPTATGQAAPAVKPTKEAKPATAAKPVSAATSDAPARSSDAKPGAGDGSKPAAPSASEPAEAATPKPAPERRDDTA